jgi:short-subunit dehydrogenase
MKDNSKIALITGASSGIGLELARVFAQNGIGMVLVARGEAKLKELKEEIEKKDSVQVEILPLDLTQPDSPQKIYQEIEKKGLQVEYLVNNAGFGDFGKFFENNLKRQLEMIQVNITALTELTGLFLPEMVKNKSGKILNVASTAAFQPGPLMAVYYATKAYVLNFSEAINNELEGSGVTVTALCLGPTALGFQSVAKIEQTRMVKGRVLPTSEDVAKFGYKAMMKGKPVAIHGAMNSVLANSVRFIPRALITRIARKIQEAR